MTLTALQFCVVASLTFILIPGVDASTAKFESWFPLLSQKTYQDVSEQACNVTLGSYRQALTGKDNNLKWFTCSQQQDCILRELREDLKSRMASASVLLGLTPGLLASIGPSVVEMAVLSTQSPFLSLLVSQGSPAVYQSRILEYEDAEKLLQPQPVKWLEDSYKRNHAPGPIVRALEYLVLCVAAFNVLYTSWQLGTKTVVSWRCTNYNLVIVWSSLSLILHVFAASTFHPPYRRSSSGQSSKLQSWSVDEDDSSGNDLKKRLMPTKWSIMFNYISTFLSCLHVLFGTMIFSSLLFIETVDAVTVILRYMTSTVVARAVLVYELGYLRPQQPRPDAKPSPTEELQALVSCETFDVSRSNTMRKRSYDRDGSTITKLHTPVEMESLATVPRSSQTIPRQY